MENELLFEAKEFRCWEDWFLNREYLFFCMENVLLSME